MFTLLLVEDDLAIAAMLERFLLSKKYRLVCVKNGEKALAQLNKKAPDLIILDWMLPDLSGPQLIKIIREDTEQKQIPILMLTARSAEADKLKAFDLGADDYLTKPVSLLELDARVRALIRRAHSLNDKQILKHGRLSVDIENNAARVDDENLDLSQTEFRLLYYLMRRPDRLHSRSHLLNQVWGQGAFIEERTVDVHILRLRKRLKPYGLDSVLKTVRGAGYRFNLKQPDSQ